MTKPRIVCHFSCGAASAVATKLILSQYDPSRMVIYNAFIVEEHPDNRRFLADCERWFNHPVTVLKNEKYGGSVHAVWRERGVLKTAAGAACSQYLKREVIEAACLPDDLHVLGFTVEESARAERFAPPSGIDPVWIFPLIERNLSKADCLAIIERAGIELPAMYGLGYSNANCIGCCKGGVGYWNKIRRDFPAVFDEVAAIERQRGNSNSYLFFDRETGQRYPLTQLNPAAGRVDAQLPDCSFFCDLAEQDIAAPSGGTPGAEGEPE